jgi:hypothetical protein
VARKTICITPVIEIALFKNRHSISATPWDERRANDVLQDALAEIKKTVPRLLDDYEVEIDWKIERDNRCEHCNGTWTEDSADYNGGCCDADEANNPDAEQVTL